MSICAPSPVSSRRRSAARIADGGIDAGEDVGEGDADLLRLAVRRAGQVHDAAHALDHEVVAGARRIGPVLAEAGDRAIDEARIDPRAGSRSRARSFVRPPTLKFSISTSAWRGEPAHERLPLLASRNRRRSSACRGCRHGNRRPRDRRRPRASMKGGPQPRVSSPRARPLDLDHVGAEIGQELPGPRPGEDAGELEHAQAVERRMHGVREIRERRNPQAPAPDARV